ncbi:synaptotagmin-15-like isoform X2 [Clytia hemisphaerica]|uniref:C2 domain-containing protein n=1 Tax=Clytia hemisphaerica TaxID=252671 RepID=A0A7M5WTH7_9CNID
MSTTRRAVLLRNHSHSLSLSPRETDEYFPEFFKVKPWNSEESLAASTLSQDGRNKQSSLNSSTASLKASPLMTRKDNFDFIIPKSPTTSRVGSYNNIDAPHVGSIDVKHYLSTEEVQELEEVGTQLRLGEVKFSMMYKDTDEKLKFILKSVSVFLKPSPSVVGCNWVCETNTVLEVLNSKKKPIEVSNGQELLVDFKKTDVTDHTLRLTVYDNRRKHVKNPVGHVIFPLRDARNLGKMNSYSKKLTFYSQPAGFNRGNVNIALSWGISAQRLDVKIGDVTNLRCPAYGVNGKEFFIKTIVFILDNKYKSYKTPLQRATPELTFKEKFTIPLTSPQLKDSTITFQLYLKHYNKKKIGHKVLVGKTVIGPYMRHGDRSLSQWEKMITNPLEEVSEQHILFL